MRVHCRTHRKMTTLKQSTCTGCSVRKYRIYWTVILDGRIHSHTQNGAQKKWVTFIKICFILQTVREKIPNACKSYETLNYEAVSIQQWTFRSSICGHSRLYCKEQEEIENEHIVTMKIKYTNDISHLTILKINPRLILD